MTATWPAKTDYATGDVLSAANMNAIGEELNDLYNNPPASTTNFYAGKNKIINGDFGIWQRGTSFSTTSYGTYYADRYLGGTDGTGVTRTVSQQTFTPGTAPVAGYEGQYFLRINQSVAGTGAGFNVLDQSIEDVRTFAGQTVTVSFWAKADSARTISTNIGQVFGSGGSATVEPIGSTSYNLTTSWARYSATVSMPSIAGKTIGTSSRIYLRFSLPLNTTFTFDVWGVQLEAGSTATPFQTATGTKQGELAACQRYYFRYTGNASAQAPIGTGFALASTQAQAVIAHPTTMRTTPSLSYSAAADITFTWSAGTSSTSSLNPDLGSPQFLLLRINTSGLTVGTGGYYRIETGTSKYLELSAEL